MTSSMGRQTIPDGLTSPRDDLSSQNASNSSTRFIRTLPPSAAAQAIFGNASPNYQQTGQFPERPQPSRQDSDGGFRYNVHSPNTHHAVPPHERSHSRTSSVHERNTSTGSKKRQNSGAGVNEHQVRTGSRHRSTLSIGGAGAGGQGGEDSSSSSRRGSGPGRKRTGKDKEASSRGQSATPSGLRDSLGGLMPDSMAFKMGDIRDSPLDEEISTIFIVGFPDDITVCRLLSWLQTCI